MTETSQLVSIPVAGEILGALSRSKIYDLIGSNELVRVKLGRRSLITRASIDALVEKLEGATA